MKTRYIPIAFFAFLLTAVVYGSGLFTDSASSLCTTASATLEADKEISHSEGSLPFPSDLPENEKKKEKEKEKEEREEQETSKKHFLKSNFSTGVPGYEAYFIYRLTDCLHTDEPALFRPAGYIRFRALLV